MNIRKCKNNPYKDTSYESLGHTKDKGETQRETESIYSKPGITMALDISITTLEVRDSGEPI